MRYTALTAIFALFVNFLFAQQDDSIQIRKIANEILLHSTAYNNLHTLTKTVGGRLSGSPQMYKAEQWGRQALQQAGASKVYDQECKVPHWVRGGKDEAWFLTPAGTHDHALDVLALGNSVGTGDKGLTAEIILINSFDELQQKKDLVKGKIVFFNYPFNRLFIETFKAYGDAVRYRVGGASEAARYGAVGMLLRSMSDADNYNFPHTGVMIYNDSLPKIPAAAIGLQDANQLAAKLSKNIPLKLFLRTRGRMLPDATAHNIIGEITGSEFPDQVITVGGHLDSWDPAEGAHDDGTGCVHAIEVLRALKASGYQPKHTIRVVLFANEENGLRGGAKYAELAKASHEKHVFALESDAGGFTPRGFNISLSGEKMQKANSWLPLLMPYGIYEFEQGEGGADVGPLLETGAVVGELIPDSQRYFDYHHARNDVFENVNRRELEMGAISMAALIYLVDKYGL